MTIPKNTKKARALIADAHDIRCYSLFNGFAGQKLTSHPVLRSEGQLTEVSEQVFMAAQLANNGAILTQIREFRYCIYLHSNLWYEFDSNPTA